MRLARAIGWFVLLLGATVVLWWLLAHAVVAWRWTAGEWEDGHLRRLLVVAWVLVLARLAWEQAK